tara:strand:- start:279 stop:710 length:432 start_codon:yes stop_codon:yes gene_type:complete
MALSDKLLPRNNPSTSGYQEYLMTTDNPTNEGYAEFLQRSQTDRLSGNLNTAESRMFEQQIIKNFMESGDSTIRDMVGTLLSAGAPMRAIIEQVRRYMDNPESIMSPDEGRFEASPHSEGPYFRKFNKGGIVSLKHLTRPLKV